jgi:hypothetical protein
MRILKLIISVNVIEPFYDALGRDHMRQVYPHQNNQVIEVVWQQ